MYRTKQMTSNQKIPLYATCGNGRLYFKEYVILGLNIAAIITALLLLYLLVVENSTPSVAMLSFYLIVPIFLVWDGKHKEKWFIQINTDKIEFKTSNWIKFHEVKANEINFIDVHQSYIHIAMKDLRKFKIEIGYAKHSDVLLIKQKIKNFKQKAIV